MAFHVFFKFECIAALLSLLNPDAAAITASTASGIAILEPVTHRVLTRDRLVILVRFVGCKATNVRVVWKAALSV